MEQQPQTLTNRELLTSLEQALRHNQTNYGMILIDPTLISASIHAITLGNTRVLPTLHEHIKDGESLTPIEYNMLTLLLAADGQAVAYTDLNRGAGIESGEGHDDMASLWVHKCRLASKLKRQYEIVTMRLRGYALVTK